MLSFEDDTPITPALGLQMIHSTPSGRTTPADEEPKKSSSLRGGGQTAPSSPRRLSPASAPKTSASSTPRPT